MKYKNLFTQFENATGLTSSEIYVPLGWSRARYSFHLVNGTRKLRLHDIVTLGRLYMKETGKEFMPFLNYVCGME